MQVILWMAYMNDFSNAPLAGTLSVLLDSEDAAACGTLCKLLGYFAQRGCTPSNLRYGVNGNYGKLIVSATLGEHDWSLLAARAAQTVGVFSARHECVLPLNRLQNDGLSLPNLSKLNRRL